MNTDMSPKQKQNLVKRILKHQDAIKTHDEAVVGLLAQLPADEPVRVGDKLYLKEDLFTDGAQATWRPARIHKFHLSARSAK